jgi:hypothetical protein
MDEAVIKEIDKIAIPLSTHLYAIIRHGRMIILEKINVYGAGYREVVSFAYEDFEKLKELAKKEQEAVEKSLGIKFEGV